MGEIVNLNRAPAASFNVGDTLIMDDTGLTATVYEREFCRLGRGWLYSMKHALGGGGFMYSVPEAKLRRPEQSSEPKGAA